MAGFLVNVGKAGEVAERSPAVISANLKEDMLLQKRFVILNRSERSVVHQVKVDQKVLYKRFQSQLVRSRLALARIMGNKDAEMELRSKNIGSLNTDIVGQTDEECSFLDKLEHRPCTASSFSPRVPSRTRQRGVKKEGHEVSVDELEKAVRKERASSAKARLDAIAEDEAEKTLIESHDKDKMRPATSIGLRLNTNMLLQNRMKRAQMSPIQENSELLPETSIKNRQAENSDTLDGGKSNDDEVSVKSKTTEDGQESTVHADSHDEDHATEDEEEIEDRKQTVGFLDEMETAANDRPKSMGNLQSFEESPPISPRQLSRRTSKAADFFQEEKKIDLVALRLKEAKSKDYAEKVQEFCEELEEVIGPSNRPSVDYYASRLQASAAQRHSSRTRVSVPGTPEDENKRCIGNIFVKSLTLPKINLDF